MGTLISKPRNGENPLRKIRTRTYSGSSLNKKPNLFKSLSKRKDDMVRKSGTLQPTRTGDNQRAPSDIATEPIAGACVVKTSPVHPSLHCDVVADEKVAQSSSVLVEEVISKAAGVVSKEEEENVVEESKAQAVEESVQVHCDTPAEAVKVDEQAVAECTAEIAQKVTDKAVEEFVEEIQNDKEESGIAEKSEEVVEGSQEDQEIINKVDDEIVESTPLAEEIECAKEPGASEQEAMDEIVRDHQEAEIAEILVNEALSAGLEAQIHVVESEPGENVAKTPEQPSEDVEPEEERPQSSEQTSDYVEPMQPSQSVSEVFADPNEVSDVTKNIEAACLQPCESKDVEQEPEPRTDHDEVSRGDNIQMEENDHEIVPIATLKAADDEDLEFNEPTSVQE